ncbi:DUF2971 domain-containing protein [Proteus vulgaris]
MDMLYKFCSLDNAFRVFDDGTLSWSKIENFNDPFEGKFKIEHNFEIQARFELITSIAHKVTGLLADSRITLLSSNPSYLLAREMVETGHYIESLISRFNLRNRFNLDKYLQAEEKLLSFVRNKKHLQKNWEVDKKHDFIERLNEMLIHIFKNKLYVICFSKTSDERNILQQNLMWAHYANDNKGICLEISKESILKIENYVVKTDGAIPESSTHNLADLAKCSNPNNENNFFHVKYEDTIPSIGKDDLLGLLLSLPEKNEILLTKMIATKSAHWKYENEIRHIFMNDANLNIKDRLNCKILSEITINKIYLGSEFKKNFPNKKFKTMDDAILKIKQRMPNTEIIALQISDNDYKYEFKNITN